MKKKLFVLSLALVMALASSESFAQTRVQLGVGIVRTGINASVEKVLPSVENVGVGVYGNYTTRSFGGVFGGFGYRENVIDAGVRGAYHINELLNLNNDKLDLYGAVGLGLRLYSYTNDFVSGRSSNIGLNGLLRAGGNYQFSSSMGGFAEIGWGPSWITAGISFDLGGR